MNILVLLDKLAGKWLDWRTHQAIKNDPELMEMTRLDFESATFEKGELTGTFVSPAIAYLADEASAMLNKANAENYISFEMQPRFDRGLRPIVVTVQWKDGESPAEQNIRLKEELKTVRAALARTMRKKDK